MLEAMKALHVMNGMQPLEFEAKGNAVYLKSSLLGSDQLQVICFARPIAGRHGEEKIPARDIAFQIACFFNLLAEIGKENFEGEIADFLDKLDKEPPSADPMIQKIQQIMLAMLENGKKK